MDERFEDHRSEEGTPQRRARSLALSLTLVAACFSAVVAGTLLWKYLAEDENPYTEPAPMTALDQELDHTPDDQALIERVRVYDVQLRQSFFERRALADVGRWLLAGGLVATLLCARWFVSLKARMDLPPLDAGSEEPDWPVVARRNAGAVAVTAVAAGIVLLGAGLLARPDLSVRTTPVEVALPRVAVSPEDTWPGFRGGRRMGVAWPGDWPDSWNAATGENILWKCAVPGEGNSSPVVWGNRVFLTSATNRENWIYCVDARAGRVAWSRRVASPDAPAMKPDDVMDMTGFAAPTPVTDGEHVWATFANADVVCFDFAGRQKWVRNLGKPESAYGLASSPILYENLVILQHDQGSETDEGLSSMIAFDKTTGKIVWDTPRPVPNSWTTPIIIGPGGGLDRTELVASGDPWVIAYDPRTGEEYWRASGLGGDIAPAPVFAGGLVFAANTDSLAMAIRPGGSGDVTDTYVVWKAEDSLPDMISPVASATHYMHVASYGTVVCYRATDGTLLWEHDFNCQMQPSPALVGSRVYLANDEGKTFIFPLADEFKLEATCDLGERQSASQAFAGGRIYVRTLRNLYCIGKTEGQRKENVNGG